MLKAQAPLQPYIQILGTAQDGGYPHLGCQKSCCEKAWNNNVPKSFVVSFALVDPQEKKWWLFEATPDIKEQLHYFQTLNNGVYNYLPEGIFITHAHIGHYTGLMQLGREVMSTKKLPVYTLPKLADFLSNNGPWSQLVTLNNIELRTMEANKHVGIGKNISVQAYTVPHRDEFSETAGFSIRTPNKNYVFIPDIDKWSKWAIDIKTIVANTDIALLDATFYNEGELPNRAMSEVPHPFVKETMTLFDKETNDLKAKIHFIHFNHTNPILWDEQIQNDIKDKGYNLAEQGAKL
ncbi:MAG: MBL fold metallo-hydrolase [Flavipsychrobacter sp.]